MLIRATSHPPTGSLKYIYLGLGTFRRIPQEMLKAGERIGEMEEEKLSGDKKNCRIKMYQFAWLKFFNHILDSYFFNFSVSVIMNLW